MTRRANRRGQMERSDMDSSLLAQKIGTTKERHGELVQRFVQLLSTFRV